MVVPFTSASRATARNLKTWVVVVPFASASRATARNLRTWVVVVPIASASRATRFSPDWRYHWVMVVPFASAYQGVRVCLHFTAHKFDLPLRICVRSPRVSSHFFRKKNVCLSISVAYLNLTSNMEQYIRLNLAHALLRESREARA